MYCNLIHTLNFSTMNSFSLAITNNMVMMSPKRVITMIMAKTVIMAATVPNMDQPSVSCVSVDKIRVPFP